MEYDARDLRRLALSVLAKIWFVAYGPQHITAQIGVHTRGGLCYLFCLLDLNQYISLVMAGVKGPKNKYKAFAHVISFFPQLKKKIYHTIPYHIYHIETPTSTTP